MADLDDPISLEIADSYFKLAQSFEKAGESRKALDAYKKSFQMRKVLHGAAAHPDVAESLYSMAVCQEKCGDLEGALENQLKALDMRKELFGDESHPELIASLVTIGNLNFELGHYKQALDNFHQALEMNNYIYSETHPESISLYEKVADSYEAIGEYKKAHDFYKKMVDLRANEEEGSDKKELARQYHRLGGYLESMGEHENAIARYKQALEFYKDVYGSNSDPVSDVADVYNSIGLCYLRAKRVKKAFEPLDKASSIRKILFSNDHPKILLSKLALAEYYDATGQSEKSHELKVEIYEITRKNFRDQPHAQLAHAMHALGASFQKLGDFKQAEKLLLDAYDTRLAVYGEETDNDFLADSLFALGSLYEKTGKLEQARERYEEAHEMRARLHDEPHLKIAESLSALGQIESKFGQYRRAKELHLKAFEMKNKLYNNEINNDLANSLYNLGTIFEKLGDSKQSLSYYAQAYEMRKALMHNIEDDEQKKYAISRFNRFNQSRVKPKVKPSQQPSQSVKLPAIGKNNPVPAEPQLIDLDRWGYREVQRWLKHNYINKYIQRWFEVNSKYDGKTLREFHELASRNPQHFGTKMNQITYKRVSVNDIIHFAERLKILVEKDQQYVFRNSKKY